MGVPSRFFISILGREMHRRKILVIAPEGVGEILPKISLEIAAISRYHDTVVLRGVVRDQDIVQAISDNDFEIFWHLGHSTADGIMLSDGKLPISAMVQYVRADEIALCVLNGCDSEEIGIAVSSSSGADVICTIGPIDNRDAIRLGQLLAGELAYCETYREAYALIATDGSNYRYYDSGGIYRSYRREHDDEMLRLVYRLEADVRVLRWLNVGLTFVVLFEAYLMWRLYDRL